MQAHIWITHIQIRVNNCPLQGERSLVLSTCYRVVVGLPCGIVSHKGITLGSMTGRMDLHQSGQSFIVFKQHKLMKN